MKIRFLGLIVHTQLEDPTTQIAVLMQHNTHRALLNVPDGYVNWDATTAKPWRQENGVSAFLLKGHVENNIGRGASKIAGISRIPQLEDMRNPTGPSSMHSGIPNREHHPNEFHALFEIPRGGVMTVEDFFYYEGAHKFGIGCVGRTVVYSKDIADDVIFTLRHDNDDKGHHKVVVIKGNADQVYVTNRCDSQSYGTSDQAAYAKFYSPRADSITPVTATNTECKMGTVEREINVVSGTLLVKPSVVEEESAKGSVPSKLQFENLDVDCTSSRYP
jgi:hypothetical protein